MKKPLILSTVVLVLFFSGCKKKEEMPKSAMFKVTIENVMEAKMYLSSGVFNTPVGASDPGAALPGNSFQFSFDAGPGMRLSFATMYGKSNDLFYAPADDGIELFPGNQAISGDITSDIVLHDAGTEVNEEPGTGPNQPGNGGPGVGTPENGVVQDISMVNDGFTYPSVAENIKVTIANDGNTHFTVTIVNLANSSTPISPGVWVIHDSGKPLFETGMADYGDGLEMQAEDGDPSTLAATLDAESGYVSPLSPGAWAVFTSGSTPFFKENQPDFGQGLESLAENGDPTTLSASLGMNNDVQSSGVYNTPVGASGAGPLLPGESFTFTFEAQEGDVLGFASMLGQSNDLFFSPGDMGIELFSDGVAMTGDVTSQITLWDAGTEVNELPGVGIHQPARLNGGTDENGVVKPVNDGFTYPAVNQVIKVTISMI